MDMDEIIARLKGEPGESGYNRDDISAIIEAFSKSTQNYNALTENSSARVQQLEETTKTKDEEIQRLKAQNFDLLMKQPGIVQPPKESSTEPLGIDALFERS